MRTTRTAAAITVLVGFREATRPGVLGEISEWGGGGQQTEAQAAEHSIWGHRDLACFPKC